LGGNTAALMCGYALFGADHMLFGSDYPYTRDVTADKANTISIGVQAICNVVIQGIRIGP
jgi:predicted TIM-barrel fold metal-dependent hydrolase